MDMKIKIFWLALLLAPNLVDEGKNTSQEKGTLPILQVPIKLTNFWCGRLDGIMDSLPLKEVLIVCFKDKKRSKEIGKKVFI